uniref:MHC class I-like antigen recognition-like domain-containing protein n=1 Tax=Bubo bubo TaxID=30461 RepID=A0A8C0II23_BUBBB
MAPLQAQGCRSPSAPCPGSVSGAHTLQRMIGCDIREDGTFIRGFYQTAYDGQDFIGLDPDTMTLTATDATARMSKRECEAGTGFEQLKHYVENTCGLRAPLQAQGCCSPSAPCPGSVSGSHTLQRMIGCDIREDGTFIRGFYQTAYDGQDFIGLDTDTMTLTATDATARMSKRECEAGTGFEQLKHYVENTCVEWLRKYVSYGRRVLERKGEGEPGSRGAGAVGACRTGTPGGFIRWPTMGRTSSAWTRTR